jgi:hypothetical protein
VALSAFGETPWVDNALYALMPTLRRKVPAEWLPRMITERTEEVRRGPWGAPKITFETRQFQKPVVEEYGCGYYGCVAPTNIPGVVFKMTTDTSEAAFVAKAIKLNKATGETPAGIVQYHKVFGTKLSHDGAPIFLLWRSEAFNIGLLKDCGSPKCRTAKEVLGAFRVVATLAWIHIDKMFKTVAQNWKGQRVDEQDPEMRKTLLALVQAHYQNAVSPHAYTFDPQLQRMSSDFENVKTMRGADWNFLLMQQAEEPKTLVTQLPDGTRVYGVPFRTIGLALRTAKHLAEALHQGPVLSEVGGTITDYMDRGLLISDLHANNIGESSEGSEGSDAIPVITDPGHVAAFHPRWALPQRVLRV